MYFTGTLYWIARVMAVYGGITWAVALIINALLIAYLALFPAAFAVIMARLSRALGPRSLAAAPFVWVASEMGRGYIMTGFPWVLLGYSQVTVLPVAQFASVAGVFGLSALVAGMSAALAYPAIARIEGRGRHIGLAQQMTPVVLMLVLVIGISIWGQARIRSNALIRNGQRLTVGLIQGNVDQNDKWDPARAVAIFRDYLALTRRAIGEGAQLVLWPESSTPFFFGEDKPGAEQIRAIAREAHVPILLGSDEIEKTDPPRYYNAAFMVRPDGSDGGTYRKRHLVPFGEYVPLKQLLFFAAPLVEAVSDFSPGDRPSLLPVDGRQMSTAICYEIVYPDLVRDGVRAGSSLLSTITNDAWFGRTSAPEQHFAQASMRAIENGRYLVRAANTGISGIVDPYGRVLARTTIFEPAVVVGEVRTISEQTIYTRVGDVFAYASIAVTLVSLVFTRRRVE